MILYKNLGKRIAFITIILCCNITTLVAQKSIANDALTADSLASGNYKDVFKSFFQLGLERLIGENKELSFSSNPFAILAKKNKNLLIDTSYAKYKNLRNLNFNFSLKLNSDYKFNGFSSGIKYAIINERNLQDSKAFLNEAVNGNNELSKLNSSLVILITGKYKEDTAKKNLYRKQQLIDSLKLSGLKNAIKFDKKMNLKKLRDSVYKSIAKTYETKPLWTVSLSDTTYKDKFMFSNIVLQTQFLRGFNKKKKGTDFELNLQSGINFVDDTLSTSRDLKRIIFNFEPGLNLVFKNKQTNLSLAEFALSGGYMRQMGTLYVNEKRTIVTLNGVLRIRIIDDIWLPIEMKYEPKTGNVFGFINIRANFSGLKKIIAADK
jgi:hypothetical protein